MSDPRVSAKNVAYLGVSLAILEASKLALDFLPNVEMVTIVSVTLLCVCFSSNRFVRS